MKKLNLFILKSFLGPFILTLLIAVFILVLQFLWLYIEDLVGKGLSIFVIFEFLGWGSATILPLAMPLATLLSSIMTLGAMGEHNELLAMKAAGISLRRILTPLIFVAFGISISAFFVSNELIPVAYRKIYTLLYDINKTKEEIKIPTGTFYNGIEGYTLRIESRNNRTDMMYDVMVYNHTKKNGNNSVALADSGLIRSTEDKKALIFTLFDGVSYEENNKFAYKDTTYSLQEVNFNVQDLIIPLENYSFEKSEDDSKYQSNVMSKDLKTLNHDLDSITTIFTTITKRQRDNVYRQTSLEHHLQLDSSSNITGYKNLEAADSTLVWNGVISEISGVNSAIGAIKTAISRIESYRGEKNHHAYTIRRTSLESYRKFSLSLACFVLFFIGAPLGAIIRKGGLGMPVIVSAIFFVLYYIIDIIGKKLATDGVVNSPLGAFISTAVLSPIGIFLTWKAVRDSALFNIDTYLRYIKLFTDKLMFLKSKDPKQSKIVFMGTPEFAVASLKALIENGYNVVGVVTTPDKPSGRGQKINMSAVKEYALELKLPILQPEKLSDAAFIESLKALNADLFVVVAFRMLPKVVWSMPKLKTFNLHASLLPDYRGAAPINWAIINGEKETGVSTFFIDQKIDTGNILFQEKCAIEDEDNIGSLYEKLMKLGSPLVLKTVDALVKGKYTAIQQEEQMAKNDAPKITKETREIDWSQDAESIHNRVRGLSPYPAATTGSMKLYQTQVCSSIELDGAADAIPGAMLSDGKKELYIKCGEGYLKILELQAAGKKRLKVKEFLAGWRAE